MGLVDAIDIASPQWHGLPVRESRLVPPGQAFLAELDAGWGGTAAGEVVLSTHNRYGDRTGFNQFRKIPFDHKWSLGMAEARRAERRRRKGLR